MTDNRRRSSLGNLLGITKEPKEVARSGGIKRSNEMSDADKEGKAFGLPK